MMADLEDQKKWGKWKLYRNLYRRIKKAKLEEKERKESISTSKGMSDFTDLYDPKKPLHFESIIGSVNESLFFPQKDNITEASVFFSGDPLEDKDYALVFRINMRETKLKEYDIHYFSSGLIVNKKVLSILNKVCPNDFQVFPVTIRNRFDNKKKKPFVNHDFFLIYPTKKVKALDKTQSEFQMLKMPPPDNQEHIMGILKLRLKQDCMEGSDIARDVDMPSLIYISQGLFQIFRKENIVGVEFLPDYLSQFDRLNYSPSKEQ